jgi:uncharacterized protein YkwD
LVTAVNQARADTIRCADQLFGPLAPLATSAELGCAARKHSADMAGRGFFAHQNPDGETVRERARRAGHLAGRVSENLAWGQTRPEDVLIAWKASPQHCRNLMDSRYRKLGVGLAYGAAGKPFWTAVFAQ